MARVVSHTREPIRYSSLPTSHSINGDKISAKLVEHKKEQAEEKEALAIEQQAQKVLELAKAASGAIKRKHDDSQPDASVEVGRLHRHAENITAACKKLRYD